MSHGPRTWPGVALVAAAVTALAWPAWSKVAPGVDTSWQAGLAVAFTRRMQWGPTLDFTYGPYGFIGFIEPFYRSTALLAMCWVFAVTWSLSALLVTGLRTSWGLVGAGVITWAVIAISAVPMRTADFSTVLGLGLAFGILRSGQRRTRIRLASALGVLGGIALLVKLSAGLVLVALLIIALTGAPERGWRLRASALSGSAFVVAFAIAWAGAGQSFTNLAQFARASASLVVGYSSAMSSELTDHDVVVLAVAIGAVAAALFVTTLRHWPRRQQGACALMLALWGWEMTKEGFVANNHFPLFFRTIVVVVALACLLGAPRLVHAGAVVLAACLTLTVAQLPGVDPVSSVHNLACQVADVSRGSRFSRLVTAERSRVLNEEHVTPEILSLVGDRTVAIEPWEDLIAWAAPELRWDPEPVVQSYSAYTSALDEMDASFLRSPRAPQRILYEPLAFNGRAPSLDPPATMEALYCDYAQVAVAGPWQVLGHVNDRCEPARSVLTVRSRFGQIVKVPDVPGDVVTASFSVSEPLGAKLDGAVLKPPLAYLSLWGPSGALRTYRFLPGTASDAHVLSLPGSSGYSPRFIPAPAYRLEISGGGWRPGQGRVTITFQAARMGRGGALPSG